ncbi:acid phosphatase [Colletotrichum navitas]|uniref:Acid phosphatase n=1 Tax=Colletotrichum navitas TaxID=681940 RepID=A0AAD8PJL1_9PEZI|nr:acid phosphatase [Colletotrichum navitas]KAK1564195.1 acid phosphatase [Colletotrichum navitas]
MSTQVVTLWCTLHPASGRESELRKVLLHLAAKVREIESTCLRYEVFEKTEKGLGGSRRSGPDLIPAADWPFNISAKGPRTLFHGSGPKSIPINDEIDKPLLPDGRRPIYCDKGELTDRGRASTLELGRQLRRLYIDRLNFMPRTLHVSHLYLRSTQYQRTFVSLQHLFRGLYPPEFVDGRLDDVLVTIADPRHETLLPPEDYDERFAQLLKDFTRRAAMKWNGSSEMRFVNAQIGRWMPGGAPVLVDTQPLKLHGVLDTISAVAATPRPEGFLPLEFLNPDLRAIMEKICAEEEFAGYAHSEEFRRLGVGSMLRETMQRMSITINRTDQLCAVGNDQRMLLFACHDSTIAGILTSLGAIKDPDWFWPPYTAYITMELFRYTREGVACSRTDKIKPSSWFVRLNYQGGPVVLPRCAEKGTYLPGRKGVYTFASGLIKDLVSEFAPDEEGKRFGEEVEPKKLARM